MTAPIDLDALRGHTAGPWLAVENDDRSGYGSVAVAPFLVEAESSFTVAAVIGDVCELAVEANANARLIAAAPDLHAECERLRAELTTRRARDAEVAALVAKWREAASGIEEGCDDDDFLSDVEHDEAVAAAMFSCADDLESALLPFQRSDDKGDAT